eukprot:5585681-Amphidinium_carterae.1
MPTKGCGKRQDEYVWAACAQVQACPVISMSHNQAHHHVSRRTHTRTEQTMQEKCTSLFVRSAFYVSLLARSVFDVCST